MARIRVLYGSHVRYDGQTLYGGVFDTDNLGLTTYSDRGRTEDLRPYWQVGSEAIGNGRRKITFSRR